MNNDGTSYYELLVINQKVFSSKENTQSLRIKYSVIANIVKQSSNITKLLHHKNMINFHINKNNIIK